jgi:hypothetical protein
MKNFTKVINFILLTKKIISMEIFVKKYSGKIIVFLIIQYFVKRNFTGISLDLRLLSSALYATLFSVSRKSFFVIRETS